MAGLMRGVPGTDAVSAKHGYYYQDVVTVLAWTRLRPGEILQVEVAEDLSISADDQAVVEQVRNVVAKLTLIKALPFLERVLHVQRLNIDHVPINFIYRTTAGVAPEKAVAHRVNGEPGIDYWMRVYEGADPKPLIECLRLISKNKKELAKYLSSKKDEEIVEGLIKKIVWATSSPTSDALKKRLEDSVAIIAREETKCTWSEAAALVPSLLARVYEVSIKKSEHERQLSYTDLRALIEALTSKRIKNEDYQVLVEKARMGESAPVEVIDAEVRRKVRKLRLTRFLDESSPVENARNLAGDVGDGGRLSLAHSDVRSDALVWCARLLAEDDEDKSEELLKHARIIQDSDHCRLVSALIAAKSDAERAMNEIQGIKGSFAETVRYGIARRSGENAGWEWVVKAAMLPSDFDGDGNFLILHDLLRKGSWSDALTWWEKVPDTERTSSPYLLWVGAHIVLSVGVQEYAKGRIGFGPPTFSELGLKDTDEAIRARRLACELFRAFSQWARGMELLKVSEIALEYCLWLELEDRTTNPQAVAEVSALWGESRDESKWLPLALRAGIEIDREKSIQALDRRAVRYGSLSFEDARARVVLALSTHPRHWIDAWPAIKNYLTPYFGADVLDLFHVEGLSIAGRASEAKQLVISSTNLTEEAKAHWLSVIEDVQDESAIDALRRNAQLDDLPGAKHALLKALKKAGRQEEAIVVARQIFNASQNHEDAEEYLRLLAGLNRWNDITRLLDDNSSQLEQSQILIEMYLDALFRQGRWKKVRELAQENATFIDRRRSIELQVAIHSGDWDEVGLLLETAAKDVESTVGELMQFAQLSASLGRHALAKGFCLSVVQADSENPALLMNCYSLAVRGRWDDEVDATSWLKRAIELSGETGPVYKKNISDLVELAPKWREHDQKIARGISNAEVFLGLAAIGLNRTLVSLTIENFEWNFRQTDPRSRVALSANAGIKRDVPSKLPDAIAIDQTALLILSKLDILGKILSTPQKIYLPHSIGAWLFYESNELQFHQPSKIRESERLIELIAAEKVTVARRSSAYSKGLAQEIGGDLALLIHNAVEDRNKNKNAYVVRVAPIHRVSSLLAEEADVEEYRLVLRSMLQVVKSMLHFGALSLDDHGRAISFLKQHDRSWPGDELIPLGSTLYLDDLAVSYFHYLKLWEIAADAPYDLLIHEDAVRDAHSLVKHKASLGFAADTIERARRFIFEGYRSDVIEFLPVPDKENDVESAESKFLLPQLLGHDREIDLIIVDDRAANKFHGLTTSRGVSIPLCSSLDLIDVMMRSGLIDDSEWRKLRTQLRRWGYQFARATVAELLASLETSFIHNAQLIESIEARSIRENLLLAQSADLLNLPMETNWLVELDGFIAEAVQAVWSTYEDDHRASVFSSWLMGLYSWIGFAGSMPGEWNLARKIFMDATQVSRLLFIGIPAARRSAYLGWLDSQYVEELERANPLVFDEICARSKEVLKSISRIVNEEEASIPSEQVSEIIFSLARDQFSRLPKRLRDRLISDDEVLSLLGETRSMTLTIHSKERPGFDLVELYEGVQTSLVSGKDVVIMDSNGSSWTISLCADMTVQVEKSNGSQSFVASHSRLVSDDPESRESYVRFLAEGAGILAAEFQNWIRLAVDGPIDPLLFPDIDADLQDTPEFMFRSVVETLQNGQASQADIVPLRRRYFDRLVMPWKGELSIDDYASRLHAREIGPESTRKMRHELVWSTHRKLVPVDSFAVMGPDEVRVFATEALKSIDLWSLTGLIESVCAREDAATASLDTLENCVNAFIAALDEQTHRLRLTCNLAMLVDGIVATSGLFEGRPAYFRRLCSFAHAAIVERCVMTCGIEPSAFADWADTGKLRFQIATLADVQRSPRWSGFMMSTGQLKQELLGRVLSAFEAKEPEFLDTSLWETIFGEHSPSLRSQRVLLLSALPGPLEGDLEPRANFVGTFSDQIEEALVSEELSLPMRVTSVSHVIGLAILSADVTDRLAELVKRLWAYDFTAEDDEIVHAMVFRVSLAASISRSQLLGDSVIQLMYRRTDLSFHLRVTAGLTACGYADNEDLWAKLAGEFIARIAQDLTTNYEAEYLLFAATVLSDIRPSICPIIGRVVARLRGFLSRSGQKTAAALA